MANAARMRPPKERPLTDAALLAGALSVAEGELPLPVEEPVGEPVETVPLDDMVEAPVGTTTVELPPVGRGTTAVVPSGTVMAPLEGAASLPEAVAEALPAGTVAVSVPTGAVTVAVPEAGAVSEGPGTRGVAGGAYSMSATARCVENVGTSLPLVAL
jgi:hypothetical protein